MQGALQCSNSTHSLIFSSSYITTQQFCMIYANLTSQLLLLFLSRVSWTYACISWRYHSQHVLVLWDTIHLVMPLPLKLSLMRNWPCTCCPIFLLSCSNLWTSDFWTASDDKILLTRSSIILFIRFLASSSTNADSSSWSLLHTCCQPWWSHRNNL